MSIITKLHQHPLHKTAHNSEYLRRYHHDDFTVLDHCRHLKQLLPIYRALEKKINEFGFQPQIPKSLNFILGRSFAIEFDIELIEKFYPVAKKLTTLPATDGYEKQILALDSNQPEDQIKIFTHFLLRTLGDLFGGQGLGECVYQVYQKEKCDLTNTTGGNNFYAFPKGALHEFTQWLNGLGLDEDKMVKIADDGYQQNINILKELEETRVTAMRSLKRASTPVSANNATLFNCSKLKSAVVVGGAVIALGYSISRFVS